MSESLAALESAISDVGYWRWWAEELPVVFQVEFGGVQLWNPPTQGDGPPSSIVALRFHRPSVVAFLTDPEAADAAPDWRQALHEDRLEPPAVSYEHFTLTSEEAFQEIVSHCQAELLAGTHADLADTAPGVRLAFRAGAFGLALRAEAMTALSSACELSPEQIVEAAAAWWAYWREYWSRRDSDSPMATDYACEVTIPIKEA